MRLRKSKDMIAFNSAAYTVLTLLSILCTVPFVLIISASLTKNDSILLKGYSLIPHEFSISAYKYLFMAPKEIINAYGVTIFVTVVGTALGLFSMTMAGYVLNRKDFKYRNTFSFLIYFTSLFSGGMVPYYILIVTVLKLQNNLLSVIFPLMMTPFLVILMRNFMKSIPDALLESSKIDGANDFTIFTRIVLPLSGPGIATVGLFISLMYWNNWYFPMLFINKKNLFPLQYYLYNVLMSQLSLQELEGAVAGQERFPGEAIKMAMAVVATGPIVLVYPFVQKYFVKGLTIGAVKG